MWTIRDAVDEDSEGVVALAAAIFAEVPGWVFEVDGEMPELRYPFSLYQGRFGRCWVAEGDDGGIVGMIACFPVPDRPGLEMRRLFVAAPHQRQGLGGQLVRIVEGEARRRGVSFVELWSDTRVPNVHRFYEQLGYVRLPATRVLCDKSQSIEYHYRKVL